jgi:hypothetical protein
MNVIAYGGRKAQQETNASSGESSNSISSTCRPLPRSKQLAMPTPLGRICRISSRISKEK